MKILLNSFLIVFLFFSSLSYADSIIYSQKNITVGTNSIRLNLLTVPDSSEYEFKVVHSNPIGTTANLKDLVNKVNGTAGINGTFFEAYESNPSKRYPNGLLIESGSLIRGGKNTSFILGSQNRIGNLEIKITGAINGSYKWPNNWYAWNINHVYTSSNQSVIYTSDFGSTPDDGSLNVIVQDGKVVSLTTTSVKAPSNGYVIHIGQNESIRSRFHIGDSVEYKVDYLLDGSPLADKIKLALGAGPKLLTNGQIDINYERGGFTSEKIKTLRSSRSFIGINSSGNIVIGTTPLASIQELASALKAIGLIDAMNLDGGASSGLYFNGKYITNPGRQISNAIVVIKNPFPSAAIIINGNKSEQNGIIKNGVTYVPLRGVLESMGIKVTWNGSNSTVICKTDNDELILTVGSGIDKDGFILNSKSYVPLRIIGEKFGYSVKWISQTKSVLINSKY